MKRQRGAAVAVVERGRAACGQAAGSAWAGWLWGLLGLLMLWAAMSAAWAQVATPRLANSQLVLESGATGNLTILLPAPAVTAQTFVINNPRADLLQAPTRVTVPIGASSAAVALKGLAAGTVNLRIGNNVRVLDATVQVTGDAAIVALVPASPGVAVGGDARLELQLSAVVRADTVVTLSADPSTALEVPPQVVVPAGTSRAVVTVRGVVAGLHRVQLGLRGQTLVAPVRVTSAEVAVLAVQPERSEGEVGATLPMVVQLTRAASGATEVQLQTDAPTVIELPAFVVIPAGADRASVNVRLRQTGSANLRARWGESQASADITVRAAAGSNVPPALTVRPGALALTVGGQGLVTVEIDAARSYDQVLALSIVQQQPVSGTAAVVAMPASVLVPAGQLQATFQVSGLNAGSARLGLRPSNAAVVPALDVTVGPAAPGVASLTPPAQAVPKGTVGQAVVRITPAGSGSSTVTLSSDSPQVASVPASVVVGAGQTSASVPVSALETGAAVLSATLNGRSASASVQVGPAVGEELRAPASLDLDVGASRQIAAQLLMTDGRLVSDPSGIVWTSANAAIASVAPGGEVTGVAVGSTSIEGVLGAMRVKVTVRVTQLPQLGLQPNLAQVLVGAAQTFTLTSQAIAPAGGLEVRLSTSGIGTVQLPATVMLPAGATNVSFDVRGLTPGALLLRAEATGRQAAAATLTVLQAAPSITISSASPLSGPAGTVLTIQGSGFDPTPANNLVRIGSVAIEVTAASSTQLVTRVPISAATGAIAVTVGGASATGPVFSVQQAQDALLVATPNSVSLLRGSEAAASLAITSVGTTAYSGTLSLSVNGLPAGVTAVFEPQVLPADRSGLLRLKADGSVAPGTYVLNVSGSGYSTAGTINRSASLTVTVPDPLVTPSTGVRGRFVTPDGRPIAGVIVRADVGGGNSPSTTTDAAGSFELAGLAAGPVTLRFDATPANPLYPIWPFSVAVLSNQMVVLKDFVIAPPPEAPTFTPISNAAQDQRITDERYPGLEIVLPAGAEIIGWDGVKKTRIAVEKRDISELPVVPPPVTTGAAYQLYFGTPMGGIPSKPIPITLPNDTGAEPGESVNVWFFDGSPMGGSGEWKIAGRAVVSADGKVARMVEGGLTRFCGVCGLACLQKPPKGDDPGDGCPQSSGGNPVNLFSGQELTRTGGMSCRGLVPIETGRNYNPIDAFGNIGGTEGSIGYGWALDYDVMFLAGAIKRVVLPGNVDHVFSDEGGGVFRNRTEPRFDGAVARDVAGGWQIVFKDGSVWKFQPFAGAPGNVRGQPQFLVELSDANGRVTTVARNTRGQLTSVGTAERRIQASYGSSGFIETFTDPEGRTERFTYNASKRIASVADADGRITRYAYVNDNALPKDSACGFAVPAEQGERLKTITYPGLATPTENHYGSSRRILRQTTAEGLEYRFTYRTGGACVTHVSNPGQVCSGASCPSEDSWDAYQAGWRFHGGQVLSTTVASPDGTTATSRFGSLGQLLESSESSGKRLQMQRDANNRVVRVVDSIGRVKRNSYDDQGNVVRTVDALGRVTEYAYDSRWNKASSITRYADDGTPQVWRFTYDGKGNIASAIDPLGGRVALGYSALGQLTSVTDPLNQVTQYGYNAAGDLTRVIDALLNQSTIGTDRSGRAVTATDPQGYSYTRQTNGLGLPTRIEDPIGGATTATYDDGARVSSVVNPRGHSVATYAYDVYGRLTRRTDANAQSDTYAYDTSGRLAEVVDRLGRSTRYRYDVAGRLSVIEFPDRSRTFTYDGAGRVAKVEEPTSRVDFEYDAFDRLIKETQTIGGSSHEVSHAYDRLDRRVSRRVDGGEETTYEWDIGNRLKTIRHNGEATSYQWDAASRMTRRVLPNGVTIDYTYDRVNRLTGIVYTAAGGVQIERIDYAYDSRGMRVSKTLAGGSVLPDTPMTATYDATDRMTAVSFPATGQNCNLGYAANGNLTSRDCGAGGRTTYVWDALDRLVSIVGPGLAADFSYDVLGRRAARTVNGVTTRYVYDDAQAVAEIVAGDRRQVLSGVLIDEAIATYSATKRRYAVTDGLGSVLAELRSDASLASSMAYSAYGESVATGEPALGSAAYTGRETDGTGLLFYRARYFDPVLKRFISEDPIGLSGGVNAYRYVDGDPVSLSDPDGLLPIIPIAAAYARCFAQCMAWAAVGSAVTGDCFDLGKEAADCALDCLNPFNWSFKGAKGPKGPGVMPPKPPRGKGSVPPEKRDPKRNFDRSDVNDGLQKNDGKCEGCGKPLDLKDAKGHHVDRHADGGQTVPENLSVLCETCHKEVHKP